MPLDGPRTSRVPASAPSRDPSRPWPSISVLHLRIEIQWCSPSSSCWLHMRSSIGQVAQASAISQTNMGRALRTSHLRTGKHGISIRTVLLLTNAPASGDPSGRIVAVPLICQLWTSNSGRNTRHSEKGRLWCSRSNWLAARTPIGQFTLSVLSPTRTPAPNGIGQGSACAQVNRVGPGMDSLFPNKP